MPTPRQTPVQQPVVMTTPQTQANSILMYNLGGHAVPVDPSVLEVRQLRDVNPHTNPNAVIDWAWQGGSILFRRPIRTLIGGGVIMLVVTAGWNLFAGTLLAATGVVKPVAIGQVKDKSSVAQMSFAIGSSFAAPVAKGTTATLVNFTKETAPQVVLVNDRKPATKEADLDRALSEVRYAR